MRLDLRAELIDALEAIKDDRDELAYFALTSKPEFQVRDRLAYRLYRALADRDPDLQVVREWKRVDLAVLKRGKPLLLLEAKALTSYNVTLDDHRARYQMLVRADVDAARARDSEAEVYALIMVTHVRSEIPAELREVVKYARRLRPATIDEIDSKLEGFLPPWAGSPRRIELGEGEAFGLKVAVTTWLFGPIEPVGEGLPLSEI